MTPAEIIKRKIELKGQVARIVRGEIEDLKFQRCLINYREILSRRIGPFNPALSAQLHAVQILLDALQVGSPSMGGCLDHPPACIPSSRGGCDGTKRFS